MIVGGNDLGNFLFCWELGGGMGHLAPHRELLGRLIERGHSVHVAVCDLVQAGRAFEGLAIRYWQCPVSNQRANPLFVPTLSMAHVLHNVGFGALDNLTLRIAAWRNLYAAIAPQVLLTDYSPTALLAARGSGLRTVVLGTGFCLPPNRTPLPAFSTVADRVTDVGSLIADEARLVITINSALGAQRLPLIGSVADLFHQTDLKILTTIRELDHYPDREESPYWGLPVEKPGVRVEWPASDRRRVFAYLKPFDAIGTLLDLLNQLQLPSMVACDGLSDELRKKYASPTLAFAPPNIDLVQMANECHFAITNANHTTTCRFLLAGKPVMMIPLHLEQELVANAVVRLGAGVLVRPKEPRDAYAQLVPLMNSVTCHAAANELAGRYASVDRDRMHRMVAAVEGLLAAE